MNLTFRQLIISALCCLTLAHKPEYENEVTRAMKQFKIIPGTISENVPEILEVIFDKNTRVNLGNEISPSQAINQPQVSWNADKNSFYTIMCIDIDAPSPDNPFLSDLITWLVVNIPGNNIAAGNVLADYIAVSPPRGQKLHRSIFLLYKQPKKLNFDERPQDLSTFVGRVKNSIKNFSQKYGLGAPIAANFYMTQFDSHVLKVYRSLNCCEEYNAPVAEENYPHAPNRDHHYHYHHQQHNRYQ